MQSMVKYCNLLSEICVNKDSSFEKKIGLKETDIKWYYDEHEKSHFENEVNVNMYVKNNICVVSFVIRPLKWKCKTWSF